MARAMGVDSYGRLDPAYDILELWELLTWNSIVDAGRATTSGVAWYPWPDPAVPDQ